MWASRWAAGRWLWTGLLACAHASAAAAQGAESAAGQAAARAQRLEARLAQALAGPEPAEGFRIGVVLRREDLPTRRALRAARRAAIYARQQRALGALPARALALAHRYDEIGGLAGWASRAGVEALLRNPEVERVYLDGRVHATLAQGVPLVGADEVHALGYTGAGVNVAILDTGIDTDHPDLADDLVAERCFCDDHPSIFLGCCPGGGQSQSGPGAAEDDDGHGTQVAGVVTSGGIQAAPGVAPDAGIVALKVLDDGGGGSFSDIAAALNWVLGNHAALGIRVVNLSLGDSGEYSSPSAFPCLGSNTANAIRDLRDDGIAVFAASGNEGYDDGISFPACVAEAISVGGVYDASVGTVSWCADASCTSFLCTDTGTSADRFVCHTNSHPLLDLLAPDWRTRTSALGGSTINFGGTSAATPYAAGEAALLVDADAALTPEAIRTLLRSHGPQVANPENGLSFTRSDVGAALAALLPGPAVSLAVTGVADPLTAGVPSDVTVRALDALGRTATGYTGTVAFSASTPGALLPAPYSFAAGDAGVHVFPGAVRLFPAGEQSVAAGDAADGSISGAQSAITVTPAAAATLLLTGVAGPTGVGVLSDVTVRAVDLFGNTVSAYTGTVHFSSSDPAAVLPADYSFTAADAGVHAFAESVSFGTLGVQDLSVGDSADASIAGSRSVSVLPPPVALPALPAPALAALAALLAGAAHRLTRPRPRL